MDERTVKASTFKQRCLALLDLVAETKQTLIVTKRGRPVARVVPVEEPGPRKPLAGSVTFLTGEEGIYSTGESWAAEEA